ncbi:unnamed protein product, partial [Hymenolepis diminuta]
MDISEKIDEIERNIQEGERMLSVLQRLPESEENNAQIHRFQELVRQLENFKERYRSLESHCTNEAEFQMEKIQDAQDQLKSIIDSSNNMSNVPKSTSANLNILNISVEPSSSSRQVSIDAPSVELRFDRSDELSVSIDPSEWRLHHERQKLQLLTMLSQIARYQDLISRLTSLTSGLDMSDTVSHLNDVGQRFTEINLRLLSLKNAYETIYSLEDASDEYKASQLKDLRGFLISLGRSLEMTKECFFTIAGIIKGALQSQADDEPSRTQSSEELSKSELTATAPSLAIASASTSKPKSSSSATAVESDRTKSQQEMELTISQLSEQRDRLIKQLAEARGKITSISSSQSKPEDTSKSSLPSRVGSSQQQPSNSVTNSDVAPTEDRDDSLPILRRLQARKEHLEELRGELHSFNFSNSVEVSPSKASTSRRTLSSTSIKIPSAQSRTSNCSEQNTTNQNLDDHLDGSLPTTFSGLELSTPPPTRRSNHLSSIASSDSDPTTQKGEAVTFQEPEATYVDNTERLYKSMREARMWREEHRNTTDIPLDSSVVATAGDKGTVEGDDKALNVTNQSLRNSTKGGGGLSESASCMDATAMATWGGSSDREEEQNVREEEEYTEDIPSVVSSRSSRVANSRRFLNSSMSSSTHRECLGIRTTTDSRESASGMGMRMPHLGHSPSPRNSSRSGTVARPSTAPAARNSHPHRRQTERSTTRSNNHNEVANISFGGSASDTIIKTLAEKITNLEFKVEQLTQTCNLLVTENARMNSYLYSVAQQNRTTSAPPPQQPQCTADWSLFASPTSQLQPLLTISTSGLFTSPYRPPAESLSGLSSVHSLAPAPPTPTLQHVDKYSDQIQMLTAEVIEQRSRMNQLQNDLQVALHQQQQSQFVASAADMVVQPSTSSGAPTNGISRGQSYPRPSLTNFLSPLAMQTAAQMQSTTRQMPSNHITGG